MPYKMAKLCLVCSGGGHTYEMKKLSGVYSTHPHFFITHDGPHIGELSGGKTYVVINPQRLPGLYNPFRLLSASLRSLLIILSESPDIILSTGAGIAVPACYIGKILGKKIIFLASGACVERLNLSSKLIYPIADLFIIQYLDLSKKYPKSKFAGNLYDFC